MIAPVMKRSFCRSCGAGCVGQGGLTLIEALVTLFVLSVGLVGLATMHLTSLQSAHSSYYRSMASAIALNFEERLWLAASEELLAPGQCLEALPERATVLRNDWVNASSLPGIRVSIDGPSLITFSRPQPGATGTWTDRWQEMTLTIEWAETRFRSEPNQPERFDYMLRVPCVSEYVRPLP